LRLTYILSVSIGIATLSLAFPHHALAAVQIIAHSDILLTATVADFDTGYKLSLGNSVLYQCDQDSTWQIGIRSLDANLGPSDDATYTKPLSDLYWKGGSQGSWIPMTTSYVTVLSGSSSPGWWTVDIDYGFLLSWFNDKPGTYQATIQYTITSY